jgi:hypothetical protein
MFPEALDLVGMVARGERGSAGVFAAERGGRILIWRRFGRTERFSVWPQMA